MCVGFFFEDGFAENSQCQDLWRHEVHSDHCTVWKLWYHCRGALQHCIVWRLTDWESHCDVHDMLPKLLLIKLFTIFVSNLQVSYAK